MKGDEARVVAAFCAWLAARGWEVSTEVDFCDLMAVREGRTLYAGAKGRTAAIGLDVDTMYGQILRRMPVAADRTARFGVVVPTEARSAAGLQPPRDHTWRISAQIDLAAWAEQGAVVARVTGWDGSKSCRGDCRRPADVIAPAGRASRCTGLR